MGFVYSRCRKVGIMKKSGQEVLWYWQPFVSALENEQDRRRRSGKSRSIPRIFREFSNSQQPRARKKPRNSVTLPVSDAVRRHVQQACMQATVIRKAAKQSFRVADYQTRKEEIEKLRDRVRHRERFSVGAAIRAVIDAAHLPGGQL